MIPKSNLVKSNLMMTDLASGASGAIANYTKFEDIVTASSYDHGNRKSPNPHSYWVHSEESHCQDAKSQYCAKSKPGNYGNTGYPSYGDYPLNYGFSGPIADVGIFTPIYKQSEVYNKALGRLNDKVRGGLDLSIDLAEHHQTRKMLRDLTKFQRWFDGVGPRRWANEWLQLQYGWRPLVGSIYDSADELIRTNANLSFVKGRASLLDTVKGSRNLGALDVTGTGRNTKDNVFARYVGTAYHACELKIFLGPPTVASRLSRWTSMNPLSVAWELCPYSFVADWFYDVGGYLRDTETAFATDSRFLGGYRTDSFGYDIQESISYNRNVKEYFDYIVSVGTTAKQRHREKTRTLLTSYPWPNAPCVNTDLSSARLLSAAALLMQQLKSKSPVGLGYDLIRNKTKLFRGHLF